MKKTIRNSILIVLAMAIVASVSIFGTIAWLSDEDGAVNVMTLGNVYIDQNEYEYNANGELVDFTQGKPLLPRVDDNNIIDKIVTVKNTGSTGAYVRTLLAFEKGSLGTNSKTFNDVIKMSINDTDWTWSNGFEAEIGGNTYVIYEAVYNNILLPGVETAPSLLNVWMTAEADNEEVVAVDGNGNKMYDILAFSQAVQSTGFASAEEALNRGFGEISAADLTTLPWNAELVIPALVEDNDDMNAAVKAAKDGDTIVVGNGEFTLPTLSGKEGVTIVGNYTTVGGENVSTGFGGNFGKNTTIKNIDFTGKTNGVRSSYAQGGTTVFENCTFAGDSTYGFHIDESKGATFIFNNCTFVGFNAFAGDLERVIFNNCTFLSNGNYGHTNIWSVGEFNNCTFGDGVSVGQGNGSNATIYYNGVEKSYHIEFVASEAALLEALNNGEDVVLGSDIVAETAIEIPAGVVLDGNGYSITYGIADDYHLVRLSTGATVKNVTLNNYRVRTESAANGVVTLENVTINMDNDLTGLDISRGAGTAKLTNVVCKGTKDAAHLDPNTQVQVDYTPYGDVLLGGSWALEATDCDFGSLHGWNTRNGSSVSLNNTTYTVFRMHYWSNRTLYINGVETAWADSGAIPVAHDVGGCWSVQPAFK